MKSIITILTLFLTISVAAQRSKIREVMSQSRLLQQTVFGTKDSATLEKIFATGMTYGHSNGRIETREEAISGIVNNKSTYTSDNVPPMFNTIDMGDSVMVKHQYKAVEKKASGEEVRLNLELTLTWIKEDKQWKLIRRRAVKLPSEQ